MGDHPVIIFVDPLKSEEGVSSVDRRHAKKRSNDEDEKTPNTVIIIL